MARGAASAVRVATAGALLLAAAGCAGGDRSPSDEGPTAGPADAYLEAAFGGTDEIAAEALRAEELVAACMAEQGFEYVPDASGYSSIDLSEIDPPPGTREFAEQFGYGYAALPEGMTTAGPVTNPNDEILAAMSEEEHEAYTRALWGDAGVDGGEPEPGGCFEEARAQVWGDRDTDPVRAALEDEIARIDAELAPQDPAVVEAAAAWSACMADAGFPGFANPPQAEQAALDRWVAFNEELAADAAAGAAEGAGALTDDGVPAGQAELAAEEAALATVDWECRKAADYEAVWREVRTRLQQEYVDAHRAELDAWVEQFS